MSGEIHVRHRIIADICDRGMAIAAVDLSVPFTWRITGLTDSNEGDDEQSPDQKNGDFKLGSVPGDTHIWSIGIPTPTVLCESCTEWESILEQLPAVSG